MLEKKHSEERQQKLQEKYQRLKYDQEQEQEQWKKKQIQGNDDDTTMTKSTQGSSLASKEIECNLIDDKDDEYNNNIVCISNKLIIRMSNNDGMNGKT